MLDDHTVLAALAAAETGERVPLSLEMSEIDPPLYERERLRHSMTQTGRNIWDDKLDDFFPQAASQWDGFRHVRAREFGYYGGVVEEPPAMGPRLGVQRWSETGIIARGVLLDVQRHLREQIDYDALAEVPVSADVLGDVAAAQGVEIRPGDVLCVRFGWLTAYRQLDEAGRVAYAAAGTRSTFAGLAADESTARALWDWHVAAVACDNPGAEVSPGDARTGSLHRRLIPMLGVVLGELFDLDQLARRCADDGRWTFLLVSVPLNVSGSVGSPANAVAVR